MLYYIAYLCAMSVIAFFMYMSDKRKAKKAQWRTKESTLLSVGFLGGAVGALLAMNVFRHKTKHWYFWAVNLLGILVHIVLGALIYELVTL